MPSHALLFGLDYAFRPQDTNFFGSVVFLGAPTTEDALRGQLFRSLLEPFQIRGTEATFLPSSTPETLGPYLLL